MFCIFKLLLLILFNGMHAYIDHDSEIILLPAWKPTDAREIPLTLKAFKKQIQLNLRRNDHIVSPVFKEWIHNAKGITEKVLQSNVWDSCDYFHKDHIGTAIINFCQKYGWEGFVLLKNDTLEIRPLWNDFTSLSLIENLCVKEEMNLSFGQPHLIKRLLHSFPDSSFYHFDKTKEKQRYVRNTQRQLTIELAVFFDEAAYRTFMPYFNENEEMLRSMILTYVSCIQAVFHHPSLGVSIDISLVHLEIMEKQPLDLPTVNVYQLLNLFCNYSKTRNPLDDSDPGHWDVGLYLTGKNIYFKKDYSILGISHYAGICNADKSCVVAEFGIEREISSGFTSTLIAAHEIGHALGLEHDSEPCNKDKYIMSEYSDGQLTWSECSRKVAARFWWTKPCLRDRTELENLEFDHLYYHDLPGREWTAKAQCELFYRDKDANVVSLHDICISLECETPNRYGYNDFTGSALEGTHCAHGKECRGGECVPIIEPPYIVKYCQIDKWSEWKEDSCRNNCLEKSKGVVVKRRFCKHGTNKTANCAGPYYDITLCDESTNCIDNKKRKTIAEFTAMKCKRFSAIMSDLEEKPGWQAPHEDDRPWIACTIHCQRKNFSNYTAPRMELLNFRIDPYFPDGTWCHHKDGQDYYCRQHYCLPESYSQE